MIEDKEKEELLKEKIFSVFLECHTTPDQNQKHIGQLWDLIIRWGKKYLKINTNEMGVEIFKIIRRILNNENYEKNIIDKSELFKILYKSMNRGKAEYYRDFNESGTIKISKDKQTRLRKVEKDIEKMKSSFSGRELTTEERSQCINRWFKNEAKYLQVKNARNVGSLYSTKKNEDNEVDVLNYALDFSANPSDEYIRQTDMDTVRETVKSLLEKKQKRSKDCYRALFTLHCIENYKDFERLYPVLDSQILETWDKTGNRPKQYEIYQQYHPNAQKSSIDAMASKNHREFLNDIEKCLKEKNQ